jgi:hypothetical protein
MMSGCGDKEEYDDYGDPLIKSDKVDTGDNAEPITVQDGQILVVRLVYGINENAPHDSDEWYKVELDRKDSKWHDMVMFTGIWREKGANYDDYRFFSGNFNAQVNPDYNYGTTSVDGEYVLTITSSSGYSRQMDINWGDEQWTNASYYIILSVP